CSSWDSSLSTHLF
nr:immunoglobulin light chain junction region [Macaca mulatta]